MIDVTIYVSDKISKAMRYIFVRILVVRRFVQYRSVLVYQISYYK